MREEESKGKMSGGRNKRKEKYDTRRKTRYAGGEKRISEVRM